MRLSDLLDSTELTGLCEGGYITPRDVAGVAVDAAAGIAGRRGHRHVATGLTAASQAASGDYAGAGSTLAQAAGAPGLAKTLDLVSTVTSATPLGFALDIAGKIKAGDPEFARKLTQATNTAKSTGQPQSFSHPLNLPGPLRAIPQLAKLITGRDMMATFQVDAQGKLLTNNAFSS